MRKIKRKKNGVKPDLSVFSVCVCVCVCVRVRARKERERDDKLYKTETFQLEGIQLQFFVWIGRGHGGPPLQFFVLFF